MSLQRNNRKTSPRSGARFDSAAIDPLQGAEARRMKVDLRYLQHMLVLALFAAIEAWLVWLSR